MEEPMPPKPITLRMMRRADELRRNQTEAEAKLWSRLRAHRVNGVQFRRHTCSGGRCQGHVIGNYIVDSCGRRFGRSLLYALIRGCFCLGGLPVFPSLRISRMIVES